MNDILLGVTFKILIVFEDSFSEKEAVKCESLSQCAKFMGVNLKRLIKMK